MFKKWNFDETLSKRGSFAEKLLKIGRELIEKGVIGWERDENGGLMGESELEMGVNLATHPHF